MEPKVISQEPNVISQEPKVISQEPKVISLLLPYLNQTWFKPGTQSD